MGSAAEILRSPSLWLGSLALVALLLAGFLAIVWTRRWLAQARKGPPAPAADLEHYRQLRTQGELSEQEFEQISRLLLPNQESGSKEPEVEKKQEP